MATTLQDALTTAYAVPVDEEERSRFRVDDDSKALWALRKLRQTQEARAQIHVLAAEERERIEQWVDKEDAPLAREEEYFTGLLKEYALNERAVNDRKSINLPGGKISTRMGTATWKFNTYSTPLPAEQTTQLVDWAKHHGLTELVRVKEDVKMSALNDLLQLTDSGELMNIATGEVIPNPGLSKTEPVPSVSISIL